MIFCGKCVNDSRTLDHETDFCVIICSIHYHMKYVLNKLWKPDHDLYFRELNENLHTKNFTHSQYLFKRWFSLAKIELSALLDILGFRQSKVLFSPCLESAYGAYHNISSLWAFGSGELKCFVLPSLIQKPKGPNFILSGQGQCTVIIWTNMVELKYLEQHIKFQEHQPTHQKFFLPPCEGSIWNNMTSNGLKISKKNKYKHIQSERP